MREIKFRVFIDGEMIYDLAYEEYAPINDLLKCTDNLMQFTGLFDKQGVEIYEGDVVQVVAENLRYDGTIQEFRSKVFFEDGSFSYTHDDGYSYSLSGVCSESGTAHEGSHFCEVIGNIYEHPHLLGT